uniref:Nucleolar GTP-binding protein 1 n=1 Tax=Panagrolaimus sp. ES5 TaxID=591445 RepID=A0AC34FH95_9BILA
MTSLYNFKGITVVPSAKELKEIVLSKTQRKTPTVVHRQYAISRIRSFYARKIKFLQQTLHDKLSQIINEFPKTEEVHPFYSDLMNILYDKDHYKIALGQVNTNRHLVAQIAREYVRLMKYSDSLYRCKLLKRAALGRMVKLLKRQNSSFEYLEQVRQHLSRLPSIDPNTRTLILCGFPNVGKSSLMNSLTRADVEVQPYAFTTKSLYVGHFDYRYLRWQIIDTPGILDQPLEQRNTIEMQAVTALAHLKATVLFMMDVSEQCDHTIEEQINLFESIRPLFANKPVFVGLNKVDIIRRGEIAPEKQALIEQLEKKDIPVFELSTVSKEGVITLRDKACDALMAQRVQRKLQSKGYDNNIISRLYVAVPEPRDDKVRAPFIPAGAMVKRTDRAALKENKNSESMECDPPKKFVIPEIWEGHNISDFLREDIEELFADLSKEERDRIEAGVYDKDLDSDDEETKKLLQRALIIREKEELAKQDFRFKKGTDQPKVARKIGQKRTRTMENFEHAMSQLGVDISTKKMKNLEADSSHPIRGKRIRVGRSQSLVGNTALPRDVQGVPDIETFDKAKKSKRKGQRPLQQDARKGEGDRHVFDMKPKHLFSGKRGLGKTTRR